MIVDSNRIYSAFLDALNAGSSPDEVADICAEALNQAKNSYEAEQRNAKRKEKEAAVDSLFSALQDCGTAFEIPELAKTNETAKDEFINFMDRKLLKRISSETSYLLLCKNCSSSSLYIFDFL